MTPGPINFARRTVAKVRVASAKRRKDKALAKYNKMAKYRWQVGSPITDAWVAKASAKLRGKSTKLQAERRKLRALK